MVCKWCQVPAFRLPALLVEETTFLEHDILDVLWAYGCPKKKMLLNMRQPTIRKIQIFLHGQLGEIPFKLQFR